jgi:hypothetical protein
MFYHFGAEISLIKEAQSFFIPRPDNPVAKGLFRN